MTLHPLWGHEDACRVLARALQAGTFPGALLLHGPRGVGKQRLALWAAQLLLCEAPDGEPCARCRSCHLAVGLQHPDLHWHFPLPRPKGVSADRLGDALEQERARRLEQVRAAPVRFMPSKEPVGIYLAAVRTLRRRAHIRPVMGERQVFVLGNAETLVPQEASPEAANALLKLLEEPPGGACFILTASEPGRLLPTVRSRAVPFHVGPLPDETVRRFLEEETGVEPAAAERAARLAAGSIGRALGFLPDEEGAGPLTVLRRRALEVVGASLAPQRAGTFLAALSLPPTGARALVELLDCIEEAIRDLAALAAGVPEQAVNPDAAELLGRVVRDGDVHPAAAARAQAAVERARELARGNVNPQLLMVGLTEELRRTLLRRPAPAC